MKPKRPHPLYHFDPDPRGFNWPMLVGVLISATIIAGSVALAVHFVWRLCR